MLRARAPVAELVDAADSKSVARKGVLVRVRPGAPYGGAARMPLPSRPPAPSATIDSRAAPFARAGRSPLRLGSWPTRPPGRASDGSRNGSPGMKCCAFIHTNDKQKLGAELSAYMMRRQSKSPDSFTVQLIEHRDHPFLAAHEGQSYLRNGQQQPWLNDDLQSFTPLR